jgi:hypothetical protein
MAVMTRGKVTNMSPFYEVSCFDVHQFDHKWFRTRRRTFSRKISAEFLQDVPSRIHGDVLVWGSGSKDFYFIEKPSETVVMKEIDMDKLQKTIEATDEEVSQWLGSLLEDYDIEPVTENVRAASAFIKVWLMEQARSKGVALKKDELTKLFKFTVGLAREALYVG